MTRKAGRSVVLDAPGLIACGIGGRQRRLARAARSKAIGLVWNKWVGGSIATIATGVTTTMIVQQITGS